jgi:hypothetical protein
MTYGYRQYIDIKKIIGYVIAMVSIEIAVYPKAFTKQLTKVKKKLEK